MNAHPSIRSLALASILALAACSSPSTSSSGTGAGDASAGGTVVTVEPASTTFYAGENAPWVMPKVRATRGGADVSDEVQVFYQSSAVKNEPRSLNGVTEEELQRHGATLTSTLSYGWGTTQYLFFRIGREESDVRHPIEWKADRNPPIATSNEITHKYRCESYELSDPYECDVKLKASVYGNDYVVYDVTTYQGADPQLLGKIVARREGSAPGIVHATVKLELPLERDCRTDLATLECTSRIERNPAIGEDGSVEWDSATGQVIDAIVHFKWYGSSSSGKTRGFQL